jgi:hypothetical protein
VAWNIAHAKFCRFAVANFKNSHGQVHHGIKLPPWASATIPWAGRNHSAVFLTRSAAFLPQSPRVKAFHSGDGPKPDFLAVGIFALIQT